MVVSVVFGAGIQIGEGLSQAFQKGFLGWSTTSNHEVMAGQPTPPNVPLPEIRPY